MRIFVVIPAYNEAAVIGQVLRQTLAVTTNAVVIDDGSRDQTAALANEHGVKVLSHAINRGLGASLATGISFALGQGADVIVTLDADGQHQPSDIPRLVQPIIKNQADVVIGSRLLDAHGMPWHRQLNNRVANFITWVLFGLKVTDSQSGYRLFSRAAAAKLELKTNRMEISSEIIQEIKRHNLRLMELPIKAVYTDYSLSKGQNFIVGLKTFSKLLLKRLVG